MAILPEIEYLRNNPNLKSTNTKEYIDKQTFQERIEEMKKISEDIIYFAKKYFYIISLDHGKCLIDPYPKQAEVIKAFTEYSRCIVLSARQTGKCLSDRNIIQIKNKKTGKIENIQIGEFFKRIKQKEENK